MTQSTTAPALSPTLTHSDLASLRASFISDELIAGSRIERVSDQEGAELIGRTTKYGVSYAGLKIPYFLPDGNGTIREYQLRRDQGDFEATAGGDVKETKRYLFPPGRGNVLYFAPNTTVEQIKDSSLPVVITEGAKKVLALATLAQAQDEYSFLPIGLVGVWSWRGSVGKTTNSAGSRVDKKGAISDLGLLEWAKRDCIILYDADVKTNPSVWAARQGLANDLAKRGANVLFADMPEVSV